MKFILAEKQNMTQLFDDKGVVHPATVLTAGPVVVTQVKSKDKDGYEAAQVGFASRREKNIAKPQRGHTGDLGSFKYLKEFRLESGETANRGDKIEVSVFAPGDMVRVTSTSKGKGFQGVVKRHGFAGGRRSHGQKHSEREAGSIGGGLRSKVPKGMRMAGRMGGDSVMVKNLEVIAVIPEENKLVLRGAVPGRRGTLVEVRAIK